MTQGRPKFDAPPVVETVLSVQFARLSGYTSAHSGWFWKDYVEKLEDSASRKWSQLVEAPRLEDAFEKFGQEDVWAPPFSMRVLSAPPSQRLQIIRSDSERMIQVQDSRFVLNWRKQKGAYPSYDVLLPEFRMMLAAFGSFSREAGFGELSFNQWEIAYVDHFKKGEMWDSVRDWIKVFPGLAIPRVRVEPSVDETMSADWRFSLADRRGRMYVSLRQTRIPPSNDEVLNVTLTARGPVGPSQTWEEGLDFGHQALNETFLSITSPEAQERWKKR